MIPFTKKPIALEVIKSKIHTIETFSNHLMASRFKDYKIVFTNGCFDILHQGHIDYLSKASDLGDELIVGVNTDASVKRLGKSDSRPLQDEQSRAIILASLSFVTTVILFDEDTPLELINFLKPNVLVKGADYDANETDSKNKKYIVGSDIVKANGGEVNTIKFLDGYSTTRIEQKIKNS